METTNEVSFSSFLAGVLMTRKVISNLELSILMSKFECENEIVFSEDYTDDNYTMLSDLLDIDEKGFKLIVQYDDIIHIKNVQYTIYDYLYNFTDKVVRTFLEIPEKNKIIKNIKRKLI